jgi:spore cortex formation protein SpoVR/YcgB (stage V sporulation)
MWFLQIGSLHDALQESSKMKYVENFLSKKFLKDPDTFLFTDLGLEFAIEFIKKCPLCKSIEHSSLKFVRSLVFLIKIGSNIEISVMQRSLSSESMLRKLDVKKSKYDAPGIIALFMTTWSIRML